MTTQLYIPKSSRITPYAMALWETFGMSRATETILPQGVIEIVFNLGERMTAVQPGIQRMLQPARCFIQGFNSATLIVNYSGPQHLFGVRLKPHMVHHTLGVMPDELRNTTIDLSLVVPAMASLWNQLGEVSDFESRVKIIEESFPIVDEHACDRTTRLSHLFYADTISAFESIEKLSNEVCYSSRHLNRKVHNTFGVSAEELIRYKKFRFAVDLLHSNANSSLSDIAYQSGFFDQAHFCRVFKSYAGMTALQYKNQKSALPFHLFSASAA